MILTFPKVDHKGNLTNGEVSLRLSTILAVEHMQRHDYNRETREDEPTLVPDCIVIYAERHEFTVKHSYKELVELLKQFNEIHE